jgi:hypothetical protein
MSQPTPIDNASPAPPRRIAVRAVLAFAALLTTVAYQLLFHIAPDAPMHAPGVRPAPLEHIQQLLATADRTIDSVSGGHNVELHFPPNTRGFDKTFSTIYFNASYAIYPRRLLIGRDDSVVNSADQMFRADVLPADDWMKQHDVAAVITLLSPEQPGGAPAMRVHPLH